MLRTGKGETSHNTDKALEDFDNEHKGESQVHDAHDSQDTKRYPTASLGSNIDLHSKD
jgi:hypothetical protein